MPTKRLYLVTGKGGVGKTLVALALTKHLQSKGRKVLYNSLDETANDRLIQSLNIPSWHLSLKQSAETYIGKKLNSNHIASWIMRAPFFNSLFNIVPGLGQMILFGHIIEKLLLEPDLTIVLDSPSTGHLLSMLEAPRNFREIFGAGLIVQDIDKMENFLFENNNVKTIILCLPGHMPYQEGQELEEQIIGLKLTNTEIIFNCSLSKIPNLEKETIPEFLALKINAENEIFKIAAQNNQQLNKATIVIPHFPQEDIKKIIPEFLPYLDELL